MWMIGLISGCLCLSVPATAQDAGDYDEAEESQAQAQPSGDDQEDAERRADLAKRAEERQAAQERSASRRTYELDRLERAMKRELDLDDEQLEVIEGLFEERREEYLEEMANRKNQVRTSREQMRELLEKIRKARQEGDREAEREVTRNIRAMHDSVRVDQVSEDFIGQIEDQLYDEQIALFRKLVARGRPGADLQEAARTRPGLLRRYVLRLNLDEDTRAEIEELYREVREEMRSGNLDYMERADRAVEFHDKVMDLLSDEEKAKLAKQMGVDVKRSDRTGRAPEQAEEDAEEHAGGDHDHSQAETEEDDEEYGS
jgi:hypothetical protein